jgi:microcystin-dependent protein
MKKYIKNTNLVPIDNKIKIFSQLSDIPLDLSNEVVLVEGLGVYQCNNSTITQIYNDGRNVSGAVLGEIRMFYGDTIPAGWLELDGSTFDTNAFPLLYSFLGTNIVPDYREMALRGGTPVGVFSNDSMGSHSHTVSGTGSHTHCLSAGSSHSHTADLGAIKYVDPCWREAASSRSRPTCGCCTTYYTGYCTVSASVTSNTSGITVGNSPWASTVTRAREVGVRYIMYAGE